MNADAMIDAGLEVEIEAAMQRLVDEGKAIWVETDDGPGIQLTEKGVAAAQAKRRGGMQ